MVNYTIQVNAMRGCYTKSMSEGAPSDEAALAYLLREQYESALSVKWRWNVYRHARNPIDFHATLIEHLDLEGHETILDVGCLDGSLLFNLYEQAHHKGDMLGVDINTSLFVNATRRLRKMGHAPIVLTLGRAQDVKLPDSSVDVALALFMLYHVPVPEQALTELRRVVKPGGKIAIATSGEGNKRRQRVFEQQIADRLGTATPPRMAASFDYEIAKRTLPDWFEVIGEFGQVDELVIGPEGSESYTEYLESLVSMKPSFGRKHIGYNKEWVPAVNELVRPVIMDEVASRGYFGDRVERYFFICRNSKTA